MNDAVDIATRRAGGIEVALIWSRFDDTLVVFAYDALTNEEVLIPVDGAEASEVYNHPFAYAHRALDRASFVRDGRPAVGTFAYV